MESQPAIGFVGSFLPARTNFSRVRKRLSCRPRKGCTVASGVNAAVVESSSRKSLSSIIGRLETELEQVLSWNPSFSFTILLVMFVGVLCLGWVMYTITSQGLDTGNVRWDRSFWRTWGALTETSYYSEDEKPTSLFLLTCLSFLHFVLFAFLIGSVTEGVRMKVSELGSGHSRVVGSNHVLVVGWNRSVFEYLRQLALYNNLTREKVVLLSEKNKNEAIHLLQEALGPESLRKLSLICRSGDTTDRNVLDRVGVQRAKRVVVLRSMGLDAFQHNSFSLKTLLAAKSLGTKAQFIVECAGKEDCKVLRSADKNAIIVNFEDAVSRVAAKEAAQPPGFHNVLEEVLSYEGAEFHVMQYEEVVGMDFLTAQRHFPSAVLAGLVCQDGHISLAPDMDRIIEPEDRLLFFSEDRLVQCDKNVAAIPHLLKVKQGFFEHASRGKQKILIVGWRSGMKNLLDYINLRSARGSTVTIFSPEPVRSREQQLVDGGRNANRSFPNIRIEHVVGDHTSPSTVEKLMHHYPRFNAVLLLMGDKAMDSQEEARYADSVALRVMTVMRSVLSDRVDKLLVEVLQRETGMDIADRDKLHIYPISLVDTFARIMAQASLQPHLHYFLLELLTRPHAHGIGLESKSDYFDVHAPRDESTTFWELSNVGAQRGRVLIGYKFEDGHTELNPPDKEKAIDLSRIDSFVTLRPLTVSIKP